MDPFHFNRSDSGASVPGRSKGTIVSKIRQPFSPTSWKNNKVAPLYPSLEGISSSHHPQNFKRQADSEHPDKADVPVKNKTLLTKTLQHFASAKRQTKLQKTMSKGEITKLTAIQGSSVADGRAKMRFWGKGKEREKKPSTEKLATQSKLLELPDGIEMYHPEELHPHHPTATRQELFRNLTKELKENEDSSPKPMQKLTVKIGTVGLELTQWKKDSVPVLTKASDLKRMDEFLLKKINILDNEDIKNITSVDVLFKKSLKEFRQNIFSFFLPALEMDYRKIILYKDLYMLFEQILEKNMRCEQFAWSESPVKVCVNTFKVFLDEYMMEFKILECVARKVPKTGRKKKETDIVEEHSGHIFKTMQYSIPTYCKYCSSLIWITDKASVCKLCKYACHKKCCLKIATMCPKKGKGHIHKGVHPGPSSHVAVQLPSMFEVPEEAVTHEEVVEMDIMVQQQAAMQQEERMFMEQTESFQEKEELPLEKLALEPWASNHETLKSKSSVQRTRFEMLTLTLKEFCLMNQVIENKLLSLKDLFYISTTSGMADPLQFLSQLDTRRSVSGRSKGQHGTKLSKFRHPSSHASQKRSKVLDQALLDPPLETVSSSNHSLYFKRGANPVLSDCAELLVKNKTLKTEVRSLQNRLLTKESSLQEMKSELGNYKKNNARQSSQILFLKDQIKDLEELNASVTRIKSLKNTTIENLEKSNLDLTERVGELENYLRIQLTERQKAEQKAVCLEKKLMDITKKLACIMNLHMEGQDDPLEVLVNKETEEAILTKKLERENTFLLERLKDWQKAWDKCQLDMLHKENKIYETDQMPLTLNWEAKIPQEQFQSFLNQLATLLSTTHTIVPATEEAVRERIQEISTNEQSWKYTTDVLQQEIQLLTGQVEQLHQLYQESMCDSSQAEEKMMEQKKYSKLSEGKAGNENFCQGKWDLQTKKENSTSDENKRKTLQTEQLDKKLNLLEKEKTQQILFNIEHIFWSPKILRLEERVLQLRKELSEMKLSTQNMKINVTRIVDLKDKTIEKLHKSFKNVEMIKKKATNKVINFKTKLHYTEQEAREDKERAYQMLAAVTKELCTVKRAFEEVVIREKQLMDFRDSIMTMMGFTSKITDEEIINQLKAFIKAYEISPIAPKSKEEATGVHKSGHEKK